VSDTIIVEPVVYELVVIQEVYELDVTAPGPQGIQGPQGIPGANTGYFAYAQVAPASVWNITHNLGINPSVTAVDSAGNVIEGTLLYLTTNTLRITFGIATSGYAYMS
jgi:hypothetical protein